MKANGKCWETFRAAREAKRRSADPIDDIAVLPVAAFAEPV
jgi:hypothetical protein